MLIVGRRGIRWPHGICGAVWIRFRSNIKLQLKVEAPHEKIYAAVKKIPRGKVATYGQIAALAGMSRHARQAGYALAATPENVKIPWHRVINAQGRVSLRLRHWDSGSDDLQRILLEAEGVAFDSTGKVNLKKFQWMPKLPNAA